MAGVLHDAGPPVVSEEGFLAGLLSNPTDRLDNYDVLGGTPDLLSPSFEYDLARARLVIDPKSCHPAMSEVEGSRVATAGSAVDR